MIENQKAKILYAIYDYEVCPLTFDIVTFLMIAEMERASQKLDSIHLVVIAAKEGEFRNDMLENFSASHRNWRHHNIILAAKTLMPTVKSLSYFYSRNEAEIFLEGKSNTLPKAYKINRPQSQYFARHVSQRFLVGQELPSLRVSSEARKIVRSWLKNKIPQDKKVITLTLRECKNVNSSRNSNNSSWVEFAKYIDKEKYALILIRDLETLYDPVPEGFEDCILFPEIVFSLELRLCLYEEAYLNLAVSNGPISLAVFNIKTRILSFKIHVENSGSSNLENLRRQCYLEPNHCFAFSNPFQRQVWGEDDFQALKSNFESMVSLIESDKYKRRSELKAFSRSVREEWYQSERALKFALQELKTGDVPLTCKLLIEHIHLETDPTQKEKYLFSYLKVLILNDQKESAIRCLEVQEKTLSTPLKWLLARAFALKGDLKRAQKLLESCTLGSNWEKQLREKSNIKPLNAGEICLGSSDYRQYTANFKCIFCNWENQIAFRFEKGMEDKQSFFCWQCLEEFQFGISLSSKPLSNTIASG